MHLRRGASLLKSTSRFQALSLLALAALAIAVLATSNARAADEKQVCVHAVERAQLARLDGKLREAREGFVTCARPVCPDAIRQDCTRWVAEVEASLPTVVVDAVWADGGDVAGLSVVIDGQPVATAGGGRATPLDPGTHTFRFEAPGAAPVETRYIVREGEKNRILHATLAPNAPAPLAGVPAPAPSPVPPPAPAPTPPPAPIPVLMWHPKSVGERTGSATRRPIPTSAFVVGGFAIAGLGGFAYAGLSGLSQMNNLRATCAPACDPSRVTSARNEIMVGDILGYVALAAAGVTTLLVVTRPAVPVDDPPR